MAHTSARVHLLVAALKAKHPDGSVTIPGRANAIDRAIQEHHTHVAKQLEAFIQDIGPECTFDDLRLRVAGERCFAWSSDVATLAKALLAGPRAR